MQFILPASVTSLTTGGHTPLQLTSFAADYIPTRPLHIPRFTFRSLARLEQTDPRHDDIFHPAVQAI